VTCHLEYYVKEERNGAFRRLKARPCESLRAITPASVAVRCVASAGAATISAAATAVLAAATEAAATATGKKQCWL